MRLARHGSWRVRIPATSAPFRVGARTPLRPGRDSGTAMKRVASHHEAARTLAFHRAGLVPFVRQVQPVAADRPGSGPQE